MASPGSSSSAISDVPLGITNEEIQLLRRHQMAAAHIIGGSSSKGASRASSQGLPLLDSTTALTRPFDQLIQHMQDRLDNLSDQSQAVVQQQYDEAGNAIETADIEIARFNDINRQIDELSGGYDSIVHFREVSQPR
jgi:hypothetical protein